MNQIEPDMEDWTARLLEIRVDLDMLEDRITETLQKIKQRLEEDPTSGVPEIISMLNKMLEQLKVDE